MLGLENRSAVIVRHFDGTPQWRGAMAREQGKQGLAGYPGVISVHELYTLEEARRRLRWTESAMRAARRRGLRLLSCGKRKYVSGREIVRFLEELQEAP